MYNIYKIFYLIAVCKSEAANTVRAPYNERYATRNMLSFQWTVEWWILVQGSILLVISTESYYDERIHEY
jgi:hypothetical protein